jgi:Ala-tRNA(Pro) deacylase
MIPNEIKNYLDRQGVPYRQATHPYTVTAQRTAQATHVSGKQFGKTVVLRRGKDYMIAVVPATERLDLDTLRDVLGPGIELADEREMEPLFPGCEPGAMPPLGGLYGIPVVADSCLAKYPDIEFNGGTHTDVIEMSWDDFVKSEHPRVIEH